MNHSSWGELGFQDEQLSSTSVTVWSIFASWEADPSPSCCHWSNGASVAGVCSLYIAQRPSLQLLRFMGLAADGTQSANLERKNTSGAEWSTDISLMVVYVDWRDIQLRMDTCCLWGDCTEATLWQSIQFWELSTAELAACIRANHLLPLLTSAVTLALGERTNLRFRSDTSQTCCDHRALHPSKQHCNTLRIHAEEDDWRREW